MEINETIYKLNSIKKSVEFWLSKTNKDIFKVSETYDLVLRFGKIQNELNISYKTLFEDLPNHKYSLINNIYLPNTIHRDTLLLLLNDINSYLDILSSQIAINIPPMKISREGVFFAGQQFDSLMKVNEIIEQAIQLIQIIDGYIDSKTLNLLTRKKPSANVDILTYSKSINPTLVEHGKDFNKQYGKLSIRTSEAFHDRFIIIDGKDFYHFGASIKDVGNRGFMFSRIEEDYIIKEFHKKLTEEWNVANVII